MATHHANSVSAIVCNYNYGDFIHETLESLARQTHRLQTLIIVDDGSDDLSRTVIDDFLAARGDGPRCLARYKKDGTPIESSERRAA